MRRSVRVPRQSLVLGRAATPPATAGRSADMPPRSSPGRARPPARRRAAADVPFTADCCSRGMSAGPSATSTGSDTAASAIPPAAAAPVMSSVSTRWTRNRRPLPIPSARCTATSRRRDCQRTIISPLTLVHAIASSSATPPSRTKSAASALPKMWSASGVMTTRRVSHREKCDSHSPGTMTSSSARASSSVRPGARRPIT